MQSCFSLWWERSTTDLTGRRFMWLFSVSGVSPVCLAQHGALVSWILVLCQRPFSSSSALLIAYKVRFFLNHKIHKVTSRLGFCVNVSGVPVAPYTNKTALKLVSFSYHYMLASDILNLTHSLPFCCIKLAWYSIFPVFPTGFFLMLRYYALERMKRKDRSFSDGSSSGSSKLHMLQTHEKS